MMEMIGKRVNRMEWDCIDLDVNGKAMGGRSEGWKAVWIWSIV